MSIAETFLSSALVAPDAGLVKLAEDKRTEALRRAKPEAALVHKAWKAARMQEMLANGKLSSARLEEVLTRAGTQSELCADFELHVLVAGQADPEIVKVRDLLASPEVYDGCETLDPLEPEYDNRRLVGKLFLDGSPRLFSFAHGGQTYRLLASLDDAGLPPITIDWEDGRSAEIVVRCIGQLEKSGRFFSAGDALCRVQGGVMQVVSEALLDFELSRLVDVRKPGPNGGTRSIPLPSRQVKQILAQAPSQLPQLEAVIDYPVPRPDGGLIDRRGYDPKTGLYLRQDPDLFPVPSAPSPQEIADAVATCLAPFAMYAFTSLAEARSAMLTAVMTAVLRPAMPVAPLIAISSPDMGVGKGYFAGALGVISNGEVPGSHSFPESTAELRKTLFSLLLVGDRTLHFDNADLVLQSGVLSSFLTSERYAGRILGVSSVSTRLPNRALVIVNGRNLAFGDGMSRRYIPLRLAPVGPDALTRKFPFTPPDLARDTRDKIIAAVLTLTRLKTHETVSKQSFGSYEKWSAMVRDPIATLALTCPELKLIDPLEFLLSGVRDDVQTGSRGDLLTYLAGLGLEEEFTSADVITACLDDPVWEDLVKSLFPHGSHSTAQGLGLKLSRIIDQPANGIVLRKRGRDGKQLWRIEPHDDPVATSS